MVELANCVICKDEVLLANIVCLEKKKHMDCKPDSYLSDSRRSVHYTSIDIHWLTNHTLELSEIPLQSIAFLVCTIN